MRDVVRVLTLVRHYLPGFKSGGPLRTIAGMAERLGDEFQFKILTSDRDLGSGQPYEEVDRRAWNSVGRAEVYYCSPDQQSLRCFRSLIRHTEHDVLYLNSFFDLAFSLRPLLLRRLRLIPDRPTVLAPRGEFSEGALRLKALKKQLYIRLVTRLAFLRGIVWQASGEQEADDIRRVLGTRAQLIVVAVDLAPAARDAVLHPGHVKEPGALRVLFLSRISPKKNLDGALRILADVRATVHFSIFGPVGDSAHWEACQALVQRLPENVVCEYLGAVQPDDVPAVMADHDLFFLPTHGENFGHVILEALLAGTPVLIGDQTPWRDLESAGVGWDIPIQNTAGFVAAIERCTEMDPAAYEMWRAKVREYGRTKLEAHEAVQANRELFLEAARRHRHCMS